MRIIKKELFFALVLLATLGFTTNSSADSFAGGNCAPCGTVITNSTLPPLDTNAVIPATAYLATSEGAQKCRGYWSGFYLGTAWGLGSIKYGFEVAGREPFRLNTDTRAYLVTNFNGGAAYVLDYFYIGAEVGYNYRSRSNPIAYEENVDVFFDLEIPFPFPGQPADTTIRVSPQKVRFDIESFHAGYADLMPGFVISRFLGFLRLGFEESNFSITRRYYYPNIDLTESMDFPPPATIDIDLRSTAFIDSHKQDARGYRLGAGFAFAAGPHLSFHISYVHVFYNKYVFLPAPSSVPIPGDVIDRIPPEEVTTGDFDHLTARYTIQPQRDEVTFGVRFRF